MSVLDRDALQASPLADLHAIASELSIDSYRRLRKEELIDAVLARQSGAQREPERDADGDAEGDERPASPGEKAGSGRAPARRRRGRRSGRARSGDDEDSTSGADPQQASEPEEQDDQDESVEGVVELLPNGSGFLRLSPPDPSDQDVYVSAAQVRRCELVSGDKVTGPKRPPRRSERFASLSRVDTINGRPASELVAGVRFEELPASLPDRRLMLNSEDPTLKAIEWLTPFGRGSRVTLVGPARSGKTEALRRIAQALAAEPELQLFLALAGVRPEEIGGWSSGALTPGAAVSFAASSEAQDHAVELVIDQARRLAARGTHTVVLVDTLDGLHPHGALKALASARNLGDGGSLTVIATASAPLGGETTVIALDYARASTGQFPALDLASSGTLAPELLVGEAGAEAIIAARREALAH